MVELKIGSTIYRRDGSPVVIDSETKVSWIVGDDSWNQHKIKKSAMRKGNSGDHWIQFFASEEDALDCVYCTNNRDKIGSKVSFCADGKKLRAIADLIGYKESL